jgi:hypothetical protein
MGHGSEILKQMEHCFQEKLFDSEQSILRTGKNASHLLEWKENETTVKAEIMAADTIGVLLNSVTVEKDIKETRDTIEYLRQVAESIEKRVTYLMEPLKLVELDSTSNALQIRSEKPEVSDGTISYFELILKSGRWFGYRNSLLLRRYSQRPGEEKDRTVTPFPLTKKQLERLLDDLIEAL